MKHQFRCGVKRSACMAAVLLVSVACACSVASAEAVLQFQVAVPAAAVPEPAPAAPEDPPPKEPVRATVRAIASVKFFPSPAIVAPAPVIRLVGVVNSNALAKAGALAANQAVLFAAPFPNPFLYGVHLFTANRRDIALASAKMAQQRAVKRRIAVARPRLAGMAVNQGVEAQMRKMLEPILKTEVSFAVRAMDLNAQEKKQLAAQSKQWFDKFVGDYVKKQDPNQQQMMLQGAQAVFFGNQERPENPREVIRKGMVKLVNAAFSKEKTAVYATECQKREQFAHQVAIDNLVERLDERVKLSPDQWKKITKSLNEHWDKKREPQLEAFVYNGNMWPGAPDQWVLPELTLAQKNIIKRINTMSGQIFFGGGMLGMFMGGGGAADVIDDVEIPADVQGGADNPFAP
jgi:hypothetical protein